MSECPSGRYLDEIRTASGLTVKKPLTSSSELLWDWSGSEQDFSDWDALALQLFARLEHAWLLYKTFPGTQSVSADRYNGYVEALNGVRQRYAEVRKPWTSEASAVGTTGWAWGITLPDVKFDATEDITALVSIIVDAQCLRQRLDEDLKAMGGRPDAPADTGFDKPQKLPLLGAVAYVGVAGLLLYAGYRAVTFSVKRGPA